MSEAQYTVDAKGLSCPMPIVKLAQAINGAAVGEILHVLATDEAFIPDVEAWCRKTGHELLETTEDGDELFTAYIKKVK